MIRVSGLDMVYAGADGPPVEALRNVSFEVAAGEFVSIVGPSGCGKTTLLKVIAGLYRPTAGRVSVGETVVAAPRRDIGLVFQNPILLPWRTALENVMLPVDVLRLERARFKTRAQELLATVGLEDFEQRYPHELSGGMQHRVALARALMQDPPILFLDEPFAALDAMTREALTVELFRIWERTRKTVLFVTHSIIEAVLLSSRVIVLSTRPGRVLEIVDVPLPFPRTLALMATPGFGEVSAQIRRLLQVPPVPAAAASLREAALL